jgi:hypothetical protein
VYGYKKGGKGVYDKADILRELEGAEEPVDLKHCILFVSCLYLVCILFVSYLYLVCISFISSLYLLCILFVSCLYLVLILLEG